MLRFGLAIATVGVAVLAMAWIVPLPARLRDGPSVVVEWRDGAVAHVFVAADGRWRPEVRLEELDPAYVHALLSLEDRRFRYHLGVDPLAIARAALTNLSAGRRVSGGSTITMQLARLLEPRPRTIRSKAVEMLRAVQLELRLSKREILAAYLQFVPFGGGREGVEAAALAWFGHRPTALSAAEVATLLAVPQDPNRRAPGPGREAKLRAARDAVARRLAARGALPHRPGESQEALLSVLLDTPVPATARPFPRQAPHASIGARSAEPGRPRLRTTLDAGTQRLAERVAEGAAADLRLRGIHNGAIVVIENATGEVRGQVGNLDFWDADHGGQIVAFDVPRSPGSALKPVIYAMAIERGLAGARTVVPDVPGQSGGYSPRNFEDRYEGLVSLEQALARSLNVPFVALLRSLGVDQFIAGLRGMGVRSLESRPGFYGLSAAVGGIELTPMEVAGIYSALARDGEWIEPRSLSSKAPPEKRRVLAPGAVWLTARALALRDRPDFPARREFTGVPPNTRWKTGTSFGHRDAWAAGFNAAHTVVVWLGNLDGRPSKQLVGSEVAAPILFDLLEALADRSAPPPPELAPPDVSWVEVCALSGRLPGPACGERALAPVLRSAVPIEQCPYHRRIDVDLATGKALGPGCREGRPHRSVNMVVWPASVRRWLRDQDRAVPEPPELLTGCSRGGQRKAPVIVSPAPGQVALLAHGVPPERQEIPLEADGASEGKLSWFVDGRFIGSAPPDDRLWWTPCVGRHEVVVTDDAGLVAQRSFEVRRRGN